MKELKPSGLFYVPVGKVCNHPHKVDFELWYYTDWNLNNPKIEIGFDFEIIGSVTAEHMDFDPAPYVESIEVAEYKYGGELHPKDLFLDYESKTYWLESYEDSFRSLLTANDVHFVNPYGEKLSHPIQDSIMEEGLHDRYKQRLKEWQQAESKLVEKILILKPL